MNMSGRITLSFHPLPMHISCESATLLSGGSRGGGGPGARPPPIAVPAAPPPIEVPAPRSPIAVQARALPPLHCGPGVGLVSLKQNTSSQSHSLRMPGQLLTSSLCSCDAKILSLPAAVICGSSLNLSVTPSRKVSNNINIMTPQGLYCICNSQDPRAGWRG